MKLISRKDDAQGSAQGRFDTISAIVYGGTVILLIFSMFQAVYWRSIAANTIIQLALSTAAADASQGEFKLFELSDEVSIPTPSGTYEDGVQIWLYPRRNPWSRSMTAAYVRWYNRVMRTEAGLGASD